MPELKHTDITGDSPPSDLPAPLQAMWWLKKGGFVVGPGWEKAHSICQSQEGTHAYDLVHALAHWIEGDTSNAAYWYRRVGDGRAETVAAEWDRIVRLLAKSPSQPGC